MQTISALSYVTLMLKVQLAVMVGSTGVVWLAADRSVAIALGQGMLIGLTANAWTAWRSYRNLRQGKTAQQVFSTMVKIQLLKVALVMLLLGFVFKYGQVEHVYVLLSGFAMIQLVSWVLPIWLHQQNRL